MSEEKKLEEVCALPRGYTLYRESNGVGGHTYWADDIGGGRAVFDTCLDDIPTLLIAISEEYKREAAVFQKKWEEEHKLD